MKELEDLLNPTLRFDVMILLLVVAVWHLQLIELVSSLLLRGPPMSLVAFSSYSTVVSLRKSTDDRSKHF
jgi:hypothetical protein